MTTTKTTEKKAAVKADNAVINTTKIAEGAREYVQRTAASAKERSDNAYEGVSKFNNGLEKTLSRAVVGYVGILGEVAEAAHANVNHALATVEKVAQAKSLSEAAQIQVDFVRENTTANYDRARAAFDATRDVVTEGYNSIREGASDMMPSTKKAA
ncbi:MAG: phasin family protein [Pseudomonadota bacterium]